MAIKTLITTVLINLGGGGLTGFVAHLVYKRVEYLLKATIQAQQISGPLGFLERGFGYAAGFDHRRTVRQGSLGVDQSLLSWSLRWPNSH